MNKKLTVFSTLVAAILLGGCTTTRVSLDYTPNSQPTALQSRPFATVGRFADYRGEPANWLGAIRGGYGNPLKNLEISQPVSDLVAKAFTDGLRSRGLLAVQGEGRYVLSGVIRSFDCNQVIRREANVDLQVILTEAGSGREISSRPYKKENVEGSLLSVGTGIFASVEDLRALTQKTLQEVVDAALDDPALMNAEK